MNRNLTIRFLIGLVMIAGLMLLAATTASASSGETLYVQKQSVNLYQTARADAAVIMALAPGRKLKETRRRGLWIKVYVYGEIGKSGWVRSSGVGREDPKAPPEPETKPQPVETEPKPAPAPQFVLILEGTNADIQAKCDMIEPGGEKSSRTISGTLTNRVRVLIDAEAVSCRVRGRNRVGPFLVELIKGQRLVARCSKKSVGDIWVNVRSKGPWGKARLRYCRRVVLPYFRPLPRVDLRRYRNMRPRGKAGRRTLPVR